jgi:hypothetical protein
MRLVPVTDCYFDTRNNKYAGHVCVYAKGDMA